MSKRKGRPKSTSKGIGKCQTDRSENGEDVASFPLASARKQPEQQLRAAHDSFRHLVDHSPFGIYAVDADFRLVLVSDGAQKVFENVRPLIGRNFAEVMHIVWTEPFASEAIGIFRHTLASGEPYHAPSTVEKRGDVGAIESYDWKVERITLPDGRLGVVCHFYDLSERQRYDALLNEQEQRQLRQVAADLSEAGRRKDEFLATLAHELRNPLAPIRIGLQLMKRSGDHSATLEQTHNMMERQFNQMVRLVDDLMDVSRISRGMIELHKERVQLSTVVNNAVETSGPLINDMGHQLSVTLPQQPILVDADLTRLAQVFTNLLNNAAKYSDRGGQIQLNVELQGGVVVVRVKDTGIGIAAKELPRIFEMFTQIDQSLEKSVGGLGIGLSLVKSLVEMHKGTVEAHSDGPGKGSEFIVRMPVVIDASQPQDSGDESEQPGNSSRRILIVDDNRDAADILAMLLQESDNDTRTAYDGQQAVDLAGVFRPDVVLLDIGLPKLNGYEVCRQIRQQSWGKNIVLIAVTGWGQNEDRLRSQEVGFDHHLVKPVDPQNLMKMLTETPVSSAL